MNYKMFNLIENLTKDIIKTFNIDIPVNNIKELVNKLDGIIVKYGTLNIFEEVKMYKRNNSKYSFEIRIPEKISNYNCINFKIAELIGHLFLHKGYFTDENKWNTIEENKELHYSYNYEYRECEKFAMALLMPYNRLSHFVECNEKDGKIDINLVSNEFNVNTNFIISRMYDLDMIRREY